MNVSPRRQIVISYGLLIALSITVAYTIVKPPIEIRLRLLESIDVSRDIYRRAQSAIASLANAPSNITIDEALLLSATTDALAGAELQRTIKQIVESNGASLVSTAFRRNDVELPLTEVPVAVRLRSSVASLVAILQAIDANEPRLFVRDLAIQSRHGPGRVLRDLQEELEVQFDAVGYSLAESSEDVAR